jgi:hypothetical protein
MNGCSKLYCKVENILDVTVKYTEYSFKCEF